MFLIANDWDSQGKGCWVTASQLKRIQTQNPLTKVLAERFELPDGKGFGYRIPKQVVDKLESMIEHDFFNSKLGEPWQLPEGYTPSWMPGPSHECTSHSYMESREKHLTRKPPVKNKGDYYKRYIAGEFGNRLQVWRTYDEYKASGFSKPIGIRNTTPNSPYCRYDIPERFVKVVMDEFIAKGCKPETMTFNEAAPDKDLILQGEFVRLPSGLELFYSRVQKQMRLALLDSPNYATGNHAIQILKHVMDPNSYEWCEYLLDAYPDHVIEFSAYQRSLGNIPRRNTLIWEVRAY